jgi:hypothetical protein
MFAISARTSLFALVLWIMHFYFYLCMQKRCKMTIVQYVCIDNNQLGFSPIFDF